MTFTPKIPGFDELYKDDISKEKAKTNYILSLDCFFDYINSLNYEEALIKWSFISYNDNPVSFLFWEECNNFHSKTINFYHIKEFFLSNKENILPSAITPIEVESKLLEVTVLS